MKARGSTVRTVARLTILILAIVATASSASSAGPQGDATVVGGRADTERKGAIDPLIFVVPEPRGETVSGRPLRVARVRPLRVARVRPQESPVHPLQVSLSEDGQLLGRVAILVRPSEVPLAAHAVTVCLVQSGAIVAQADLDSDGVFHMNVSPGVYSLIAVGSGGFAASSIHVLPPDGVDDAFPHAVVTQWSQATRESTPVHAINLVAVPPNHFGALERLLEEHVRVRPRLALSTSETPNAMEQGNGSHVRTTAVHDPMGVHAVRLGQEGRLSGRMRRLHLETGRPVPVSPLTVFFIRDGVSTGGTKVDENGAFELNGLEPGAYSVVAIGPDGFAAFDILVLPPREVVLLAGRNPGFRAVGNSRQSQDVPAMLDGSLVALQDVQEVLFQEDPDLPPMDGPPAEFFGGPGAMAGGGAGGSAFGGGSLAEALLGAGVGAAVGVGIGTAVAHDHVASPFSP